MGYFAEGRGFVEVGRRREAIEEDVISGRFSSTLNPYAQPYVPTAYRAVEDFSDEWWGLVKSSPWFRDYWLRECFEEPETDTDFDFADIYDAAMDDTDSLFYSFGAGHGEGQCKGERIKMEVVSWGAEKWRGPRGEMVGPRYGQKAPKIVSAKVSPRTIQQPR